LHRFILTALLLAGCAAQLPPPTEADALRGSALYPGLTLGDLAQGRQRYVQHCSGCHALVRPEQKSAAEWPKMVVEMKERAKLSDAETAEIARYLVVASSAPR
jgi:mono/diheme cytochrome c family protein